MHQSGNRRGWNELMERATNVDNAPWRQHPKGKGAEVITADTTALMACKERIALELISTRKVVFNFF